MSAEMPPTHEPERTFASLRDEMLYLLAANGWANESSGSTDCETTGWFARITNENPEIPEIVEAFEEEFHAAGFNKVNALLGHYLLIESIDHTVTVRKYRRAELRDHEFSAMREAYDVWLDGQA